MNVIVTFQAHQYKDHKKSWERAEVSPHLAHHNQDCIHIRGMRTASMGGCAGNVHHRSPASPTLPIPGHFHESSLIHSDLGPRLSHLTQRFAFIHSYPMMISTGRVFLRNCFSSLFSWVMQFEH